MQMHLTTEHLANLAQVITVKNKALKENLSISYIKDTFISWAQYIGFGI
jgi:hypothetical protein